MVILLLSYFSRYGTWRTDGRTDGRSQNNQNFWDRWVTKFSKVWGSARAPSVRGSSAIIGCAKAFSKRGVSVNGWNSSKTQRSLRRISGCTLISYWGELFSKWGNWCPGRPGSKGDCVPLNTMDLCHNRWPQSIEPIRTQDKHMLGNVREKAWYKVMLIIIIIIIIINMIIIIIIIITVSLLFYYRCRDWACPARYLGWTAGKRF